MRHAYFYRLLGGLAAGVFLTASPALISPAPAQQRPPNILVIMGDDVGWFNIGAYHQGIMAGKTPNLGRLAANYRALYGEFPSALCGDVTAWRSSLWAGPV